ncbi:NAD-dependent epimerase/dehydratase family protein [Streptomyces sp. HB2AG]|uniref:NAD-dependent epimerase/dehydratase family protein n=1 Tax=Streptomyces sp. HB2AG TaxID=2983400 RepID=UPI0022AA44D8|nr:NAD-dependent epimerase/dehydratase family protein [Streptomyces sp. HB2AG]MCZ2525345.1 NAD-dependent epimerase/dehydratase family protein [Streptomyces sp. HB2AG]
MSDSASPAREGARIVVTGATGNVGTEVVRALGADPRVASVLGLARRVPRWDPPKTRWAGADITHDDLAGHFLGADAVVHLAWTFQPTHDPVATWRNNVLGGVRVLDAVVAAGVPALVHASSVGAYSPGPGGIPVDESWPTHGWPDTAYCREKAYLERVLDCFECENRDVRVVRLRPGFVFKREAAAHQLQLFAGRLLPPGAVRPELLPVLPAFAGLRFQALHASDAAEAYRLAALGRARGAFNVAAGPVVDADVLADVLNARAVPFPRGPLRTALSAAWRLRLLPASPHLFDAVVHLPVMDTARAREELGWSPRYGAREAVAEFLDGLRGGDRLPTDPLSVAR